MFGLDLLAVVVHVLQDRQNLFLSEDGKEMFQDV